MRNDLVEEKKQSWRSFFEQNQRSWLDDSKPKQIHRADIFFLYAKKIATQIDNRPAATFSRRQIVTNLYIERVYVIECERSESEKWLRRKTKRAPLFISTAAAEASTGGDTIYAFY